MTKEKIVNRLTELGIKFDIAEKKAVLYALLPETVRLEIEKTETDAQKAETATEDSTPSVVPTPPAPPVIPPDSRKPLWDKLVALFKAQHQASYEARAASGEDFSIIPPSFQGKVTISDKGKEIIS